MSYDVDELFRFCETERGYEIVDYLKKDDRSVTELEIPAEYNGLPVVSITMNAFSHADYLKSIVLPKSLEKIEESAFWYCYGLESVVFNSAPSFEKDVFFGCESLPADIALMGLLGSCDLSVPFDEARLDEVLNSPARQLEVLIFEEFICETALLSPKVFELAAKNKCFRNVDISVVLKSLKEKWDAKLIRIAGEHGLFDKPERVDEFTEHSVRQGTTELTAYLLDLKRRKFGFSGFGEGDDSEL